MEITLVWSWFSFVVGMLSAIVGLIVLLVLVAMRQFAKQKKQAEQGWDSVDKLFQGWAGRDNSNNK